ncbi:MAG: trypsin-like peptidase domain-containing protein [Desulfobacterales bacterium]|nr:trypsin-like peptidase domain-containing protein [Desulfobacterales bacterium]
MSDRLFTRLVLCLILTAAAVHAPEASAKMQIGETMAVDFKTEHPYPAGKAPRAEAACFEIGKPGATFITVHFSGFSINPGDVVEIRDSSGRLIQSITDAAPGKSEFWSFAADGEAVHVRLISNNPAGGAHGFDIDRMGYGFRPSPGRTLCGSNDLVDIECLNGTPQYERARAVGWMKFMEDGRWYGCTGFLASAMGHFIGAGHCLENETDFETLQVRFDYKKKECDGEEEAEARVFYGREFMTEVNEELKDLDVAIMTLAGDPQDIYGYLELDPRDVLMDETIYIPQIANHDPMTYDEGPVVEPRLTYIVPDADFGYWADTQGGSSGAPVLSMSDHKVVGIHHMGECYTDQGYNWAVLMKHVHPIIAAYLEEVLRITLSQTKPGDAPTYHAGETLRVDACIQVVEPRQVLYEIEFSNAEGLITAMKWPIMLENKGRICGEVYGGDLIYPGVNGLHITTIRLRDPFTNEILAEDSASMILDLRLPGRKM